MAMSQTTQSMIKVELDMALERPDQLELAPLALPALPRSSRLLRSNSVFLGLSHAGRTQRGRTLGLIPSVNNLGVYLPCMALPLSTNILSRANSSHDPVSKSE
jgi:hypothetical protein